MLSALLLTLSVCAVSAAPTTATRNSAAKSPAPATQSAGNPTLSTSIIPGGALPGQNPASTGVPKVGVGGVVVVGPGVTFVYGGISYPAGTYVVGKDGKLVPVNTTTRPFRK